MTNYQELSDNAIKQALEHELAESEAMKVEDYNLASFHFEKAKEFKSLSNKYLKQVK